MIRKSVHELLKEKRTLVMGVLNVTPDSFYDGGKCNDLSGACERAVQIEKQGADIIDIGGESTRPGSSGVSLEMEINRVIPVIKKIRNVVSIPISIDTQKAEVASLAIQNGAGIVNDISALRTDPEMINIVSRSGVFVIITHMQGTPHNMQKNPFYKDVISEVKYFFRERIKWFTKNGGSEENIMIDPGIGFGKRLEDNLFILKHLGEFQELNKPIVIGVSRKSFIGNILGVEPEECIFGTAASIAAGIISGANIVRVHDVGEMKQVSMVVDRINNIGVMPTVV